MLAHARQTLQGLDHVSFRQHSIEDYTPTDEDLVHTSLTHNQVMLWQLFSNAALHWVPDHAALYPRLMHALKPGAVLAAQVHCDSRPNIGNHGYVRSRTRGRRRRIC